VGKKVDVVPKEDGKSRSWKRVEEYRINKPSRHFKKKKIEDELSFKER
jgi:hypothetical protein